MPRETKGAGWLRGMIQAPAPIASGTAAEEYLTDLVPGFGLTVESVHAVVRVPATGAGATRTFRLVKGASTVVATGVITLANMATKGAVLSLTVTAADATFGDADTLSIDTIASGAVSFTAGELLWIVKYRTRPQQLS